MEKNREEKTCNTLISLFLRGNVEFFLYLLVPNNVLENNPNAVFPSSKSGVNIQGANSGMFPHLPLK